MRIAGRRPLVSSALPSLRAWLALVAIVVACAAVYIADPLSLRTAAREATPHRAQLTLADTFGIGGLPSLTFEGDGDASLVSGNAIVA